MLNRKPQCNSADDCHCRLAHVLIDFADPKTDFVQARFEQSGGAMVVQVMSCLWRAALPSIARL